MELTTLGLSDLVKLGQVIFEEAYQSVPQSMIGSGLVKQTAIPANSGNTREFSEIDSNEYLGFKGEGDQAGRGKVVQGYSKVMTMYRIGENIGITYEMRTQNKYPEIVARLTNAGRKGANRIDLDLTHRLTFGTATSYTDMDGRSVSLVTGESTSQQLFDTDHPLSGSSTTYRNRLANNPAVSKGAIEGMERLITENTFNNFGEKVTAPFDIIFTTDDPNTVNTVKEYLKSTSAPDAAHAGVINVYAGAYKHVILPRLATTAVGAPDSTKRGYWGIASSRMSSFHLGVWEQPHLVAGTVGGNAEDIQTDDIEFRSRAGLGICIVSSAFIKFSSGNGVA
jgi:hypothetical protein